MRILAIAAISFSAGIYIEQYIPFGSIALYVLYALIAAGAVCFAVRKKSAKIALLLLLPMAVGISYSAVYANIALADAERLAGNIADIRAEAVDFPEEREYGIRVEVKLDDGNGGEVASLLYIYNMEADDIAPGDVIELRARMQMSNEIYGEEIDTFRSKGIYLFAYQQTSVPVNVIQSDGVKIKYFPQFAAKRLSDAADVVFLDSVIPFMKAIILGERTELYEDSVFENNLQISGIFHVVAVSGMHIIYLVGLIMLLCNKNRRLAAVITAPALIVYMLMTGAEPSVQRAVIMQLFVIAAPIFYREYDAVTSISAALALILAINPFSAKSIGLQLSFAATFGIILLGGRMYETFTGDYSTRLSKRSKVAGRALKTVAGFAATTLSAMVFTVPLTAVYFGYISLISVVTNIAVVWLIPLCFELGLFAVIIGLFCAPAGFVIGLIPSLISMAVEYIVSVLASFKFSAIYTVNPYITIWLVMIYAIVFIFAVFKTKLRGVLTACIIGTASFCVIAVVSTVSFDNSGIQVTALDVGQGQCIVISAGGRTVMVDCGGDYEDAGKLAAEYVLSRGNGRIDAAIFTHFDSDHVNGFETFASRINIGALVIPSPDISDTDLPEEVIQTAKAHGIEVIDASGDMTMSVGEMTVSIISMKPYGGADENNSGLVVICSGGEFDALITGDIDTAAERELINNYELPDIEVLVAGHHGSRYSTGSELLYDVTPETAIISVGNNSYGHPSGEVIERLQDMGIIVLRTDILGNVTVGAK